MARLPFYAQHDAMDCGPACLQMIAKFHGKTLSQRFLRESAHIDREGVSLLGLSDAAETIGIRSLAILAPYEKLREAPLPCIAHWEQNHFVVVYKATRRKVTVGDPGQQGLVTYSAADFVKAWASSEGREGICLLLEPTPDFHVLDEEKVSDKTSFKFLFAYLLPHKKFFVQLLLGLCVGSALQLLLPFLTQALVDVGINNRDIGLIYIILAAQVVIFVSKAMVEAVRSWILLHISTRINISIISDFLVKLMKLPMPFFDTKMTGDILQRISDHRRIENFLSVTTLSVIFSLINLLVLVTVLTFYSVKILVAFGLASIASALWILIFLKRRRGIDSRRFGQQAENQSKLIQLITGMQEIKLSGAEKQKRWEWERIQVRLFKTNAASLVLEQYQQNGALFINQFKTIFITFLAAREVIDGRMTLGMMMAVASILGQLDGPINQLLSFVGATQDAKLSLERLGEIHASENEELAREAAITDVPGDTDISVDNLSFAYPSAYSECVLRNVTMSIPHGKVTAIVGASGSGKTTLLKLLLKFYAPTSGNIRLGDVDLSAVSGKSWRRKCGVVMQDGFIFSDTIARNIALGEETVDKTRLVYAARAANIHAFIESLPVAYNTKIGAEGHGLSQGQKQRILIARAVYKNPAYLFFDEATSSLDARNELVIMQNLEEFFVHRTVVVIAHRLSTVKKADQIVVLDQGCIVESGRHLELAGKRGHYYDLVKNQLELGH